MSATESEAPRTGERVRPLLRPGRRSRYVTRTAAALEGLWWRVAIVLALSVVSPGRMHKMANVQRNHRTRHTFGQKLSSALASGLQGNDAGSSAPQLSEPRLCMMCLKRPGNFVCINCNANYCSEKCFNDTTNHHQCIQATEREQARMYADSLRGVRSSPCEQQKMLDLLEKQRIEEQNRRENIDEEFQNDLISKLGDVDLEDPELDMDDVLNRLPAATRDQLLHNFQNWLDSDEGRKETKTRFERWQPYWMTHSKETYDRLRSLSSEASSILNETNQKSSLPKPPQCVISSSNFLLGNGESLSPFVKYGLLNILLSYAYITRLYNGGHNDDATSRIQASLDIVQGSCSLRAVKLEDAQSAIIRAVHDCGEIHKSDEVAILRSRAARDLCHIVLGEVYDQGIYMEAAISDLHNLFSRAKNDILKLNPNGTSSDLRKSLPNWLIERCIPAHEHKIKKTEDAERIYKAQKKCEFLLLWLKKYGSEMRSLLLNCIEAYKRVVEMDEQVLSAVQRRMRRQLFGSS